MSAHKIGCAQCNNVLLARAAADLRNACWEVIFVNVDYWFRREGVFVDLVVELLWKSLEVLSQLTSIFVRRDGVSMNSCVMAMAIEVEVVQKERRAVQVQVQVQVHVHVRCSPRLCMVVRARVVQTTLFYLLRL